MKITVIEATGHQRHGGGIDEEKKKVEIEVPEGSTVTDVWEQGKIATGGTPFVAPIINRQEILGNPSTKIVIGSHELKERDTLYLVYC